MLHVIGFTTCSISLLCSFLICFYNNFIFAVPFTATSFALALFALVTIVLFYCIYYKFSYWQPGFFFRPLSLDSWTQCQRCPSLLANQWLRFIWNSCNLQTVILDFGPSETKTMRNVTLLYSSALYCYLLVVITIASLYSYTAGCEYQQLSNKILN